jgi:ankyrin repeat protein
MLEVPLRLRRAIHVDNLPIVMRILKNHPNALPTPDISGNTSLHLAASWGRLSITKFLVEREGVAAVSRRNSDGDTPLLLAAAAGHDDVVTYLAVKGGREAVDTKNRLGYTPLMVAAVAGVDDVINVSTAPLWRREKLIGALGAV